MNYACVTSAVEVECFSGPRRLPLWALSRLCPLCLGLSTVGADCLINVSIEDPIVTDPCEACVQAATRLWNWIT